MVFSVITLFPEMFQGVFASSIIKRARQDQKITINFVNLRDFGIGKHKIVDDTPYGGGVGMVLKVDVVDKAIDYAKAQYPNQKSTVILLDPKGEKYSQTRAEDFSKKEHIILACGHYEGFDERIRSLVDREISIGDFIMSGGEIPAMIIVESVTRLVTGVLKKDTATTSESFSGKVRILEFPQYTRPHEYKDMKVPDVLLSGDPKKVEEFRNRESQKMTKKRRPDLLKK